MRAWNPALLVSIAAIVSLLSATPARACTTFLAPTARGPLVGKSFDWSTGEGWIVLTERGRVRRMVFPGETREGGTWTARHASLSFTTVGPGFPASGMNEAGLVIESLVDLSLEPSAEPEPSRLTGLELVQYGLDRFATVRELGAFARSQGVSQLGVALHFFACDRSGACIVIESEDGEVHVTRTTGNAQALANQPVAQDREDAEPSMLGSFFGLGPTTGSSAARFGLVTRSVAHGEVDNPEQAFRLLDRVASRSTRWQLVWEPSQGVVHFKLPDRAQQEITLRIDGGARCQAAPQVLRIGGAAAPFARWTEQDAKRGERAVLAQVGDSRSTRALARMVAAATLSSHCRTLE